MNYVKQHLDVSGDSYTGKEITLDGGNINYYFEATYTNGTFAVELKDLSDADQIILAADRTDISDASDYAELDATSVSFSYASGKENKLSVSGNNGAAVSGNSLGDYFKVSGNDVTLNDVGAKTEFVDDTDAVVSGNDLIDYVTATADVKLISEPTSNKIFLLTKIANADTYVTINQTTNKAVRKSSTQLFYEEDGTIINADDPDAFGNYFTVVPAAYEYVRDNLKFKNSSDQDVAPAALTGHLQYTNGKVTLQGTPDLHIGGSAASVTLSLSNIDTYVALPTPQQ